MKFRNIVAYLFAMVTTIALTMSLTSAFVVSSSSAYLADSKNVLHAEQGNDVLDSDITSYSTYTSATPVSSYDEDFTATITSSSYTDYGQSYTVHFVAEGTTNYLLGYYGEGDLDLPLSCYYEYTLADGTTHHKVSEFQLNSVINSYDGVGPTIGDDTADIFFDIDMEKGSVINGSSLEIFNIFPAKRVVTLTFNVSATESFSFKECDVTKMKTQTGTTKDEFMVYQNDTATLTLYKDASASLKSGNDEYAFNWTYAGARFTITDMQKNGSALAEATLDVSENNYLPNLDQILKFDKVKTNKKGSTNYYLSDYLSGSLNSINTFFGYTAFDVTLHNNTKTMYLENKGDSYEEYKDAIEVAGTSAMYYQFPSLSSTYLEVQYKHKENLLIRVTELAINSTLTITEGDVHLNFLLPDVDNEEIDGFAIRSARYAVSIVAVSGNKEQIGTKFSTRVGTLFFEPAEGLTYDTAKRINVSLILILVLLFYVLGFALVALALYFFKKNRYKNDEFRRVNDRSYLKTGILSGVLSAALVSDIAAIILRGSVLACTLAVFNPMDNFIVVLSIISIFAIGYFVKMGITIAKNYAARREAIRLKLDEKEEVTDGTK